MTIIAFDGKHLVADGASTFGNPRYKKTGDKFHKNKIVVPSFDWYDEGEKITIKALVGTGTTDDIEDVIDELMVAGKLGLCLKDHFGRIGDLLRDRVDVHVVMVGIKHFGDKTQVFAKDAFRSKDYLSRRFHWTESRSATPAIAGYIYDLPQWKLDKDWKSAVEIVSFGSALRHEHCGGLLTRYNILTGKIDHPKHTAAVRLNSLLNRYEKEEIEKIRNLVDSGREFLKAPKHMYP